LCEPWKRRCPYALTPEISHCPVRARRVGAALAGSPPPDDVWNPANPSDELNFYEIYNALYGTSFTSSAELNPFYIDDSGVFDFGDASITIDARVHYAGSMERFGTTNPPEAIPPRS
jgi:hypothetical protein